MESNLSLQMKYAFVASKTRAIIVVPLHLLGCINSLETRLIF